LLEGIIRVNLWEDRCTVLNEKVLLFVYFDLDKKEPSC
jgi:hypothetical protein